MGRTEAVILDKLNKLHDINFTSLADLHILQRDTATSKWVNRTLDAAGISAVGHTHTLSAGATDVTATAVEVNLLDLSGLSVGDVLAGDGASSASWRPLLWGEIDKTISDIADITTRSHTSLTGIGTNTHAQIDTHIADNTIHFTEGSIDHGSIVGLSDDDHSIYALLAGRSGGQTLIGGDGISDNLTLQSTSHATRGSIIIADNLELDNTTNANQFGIVTKNGSPFVHNFNYGNNGTVTTEGNNTFVGINAGNLTMGSTATQTYHASYNTFIGRNAGSSNTTGFYNTFIGQSAGSFNTTGNYNTFNGMYAGKFNTTGFSNTFTGLNAGYSNTTGNYNTFIGRNAGFSNTTGNNNTFIGRYAGRYIQDGSTPNQTTNSSVFLGYNTKALADGDTNEIVIGYNATGAGSNSAVLGNDSVTKTLLKGNVLIGTTSGSNKLTVAGVASIGSGYAGTAAPTNGMIIEGDVGIGTSAIAPGAKVDIAADGEGCYVYCTTHRTTTGGGGFVFRTSKGTQASPVAITSGSDYYGVIWFEGYDGSTYRRTAGIEARVDGTPGLNDMPSRLLFRTTLDGTSAMVDRMQITNAGNVLVNTTSFGSSAAGVFAIGNGTAPTSSPADMIQIFSEDISAGNATLGLRTETAVVAETDETKFSDKLPVRINGATYYLMLTQT